MHIESSGCRRKPEKTLKCGLCRIFLSLSKGLYQGNLQGRSSLAQVCSDEISFSGCPDHKTIFSLLRHESVDILLLVRAFIAIVFLTFV